MSNDRDQNDNRKVKDDDEKRLLDSYQSGSKKFGQSFGILLGFALVFLFVILLPYVSILEKSYGNHHQLTVLSSEIKEHNQTIYYR
jgi:hypothetical protein